MEIDVYEEIIVVDTEYIFKPGEYLMNVSKGGYDATIDVYPNHFVFKSDLNTFKILANATLLSQTVNTNPKVFSIAHGLDYVPNYMAYAQFPDGKVTMPQSMPYTLDLKNVTANRWYAYADDTYLYFSFDMYGSSYNVDIEYFIFESTITI